MRATIGILALAARFGYTAYELVATHAMWLVRE